MTAPSGHDGATAKALRDKLAELLYTFDESYTGQHMPPLASAPDWLRGQIYERADAALAVVREHVGTEEAMRRCSISMGMLPSNYTRPQLYRAFLSAALGE
jgi:hypothetical protein